jgi:hypothetical protein
MQVMHVIALGHNVNLRGVANVLASRISATDKC